MTTITVFRRPTGEIAGFRSEGHAGFRARRDIVCSAVSALTQTAVNGMEAVAGVRTHPMVGDGLLEVFLPDGLAGDPARDCQIILRTMVQGLKDIEESYPAQVRVLSKEWRGKHA